MRKINLLKAIHSTKTAIIKHSPEIFTGIGIAGAITTTVLAVKATPKAMQLIEEEKNRQNYELLEQANADGNANCCQIVTLKPIDVIKVAWKPYIPATITGILSITCLISAISVSARRTAALATAYKISETALSEYKNKVIETIGERKEKVIRDNIAKDKIEANPVGRNEVIITEKGNTLCYDAFSDRYFKSDIDKLKKSINEINRTMLIDMYVSLNEFYDEIGLGHISIGNTLGWKVDDGRFDLHFSSQISEDGVPCIVIDFETAPHYGYNSLY